MTRPPEAAPLRWFPAAVFDLDGTLAQTEDLKARAYGRVIGKLQGTALPRPKLMALLQRQVGQTDEATCRFLTASLGLEEACRRRQPRYGVAEPWQVLAAMRAEVYGDLIHDQALMREQQRPEVVALLRAARAQGSRVALATSSVTVEAEVVLRSLGITELFDAVIGVDQVTRPKPDPEIYLKAASALRTSPAQCLAVEDSVIGMRAAVASGMRVIAVPNHLTAEAMRQQTILGQQWVVYDPSKLLEVAQARAAWDSKS